MPIDIMFDTGDMMSAPRGPDCACTAAVMEDAETSILLAKDTLQRGDKNSTSNLTRIKCSAFAADPASENSDQYRISVSHLIVI
ncbi:hypothetical protein K3740_19260 (plasmid) [Ruegeria conchae]|uniref:hypothetical protein n=1 Tax=Ruegeria conchae TaxID=981384 RepID=UPI0021A50574|nr:hypothetical protein [Ruegeria conchae]UWR05413.1 hypothetical protein K3740_19260 [Ruegeria conchae]